MLDFQVIVMDGLRWLVLAGSLWALIDVLIRPARAFEYADKLTKNAWLLILGLNLVVQLVLGGFWLLAFAGIVATLVYLLDVRPAVAQVPRR